MLIRPFFRRPLAVVDNPGLEFANSVGVLEKALGGNAFISSSALREDR